MKRKTEVAILMARLKSAGVVQELSDQRATDAIVLGLKEIREARAAERALYAGRAETKSALYKRIRELEAKRGKERGEGDVI